MASEKMVYKELKDNKNSIEFVFSSNMKNIDHVCEKITHYLRTKIKVVGSQLFSINLVLREGLTNAIRHGNANDPQKEVRLLMFLNDSGSNLHFEIEDQGRGFDWKKYQKSPASDDEDHGRGIPIMSMYFDHYFYNANGNILYLEKNIQP